MGTRIASTGTRRPRPSVGRRYFYPGEVVRILRLDGIDYTQLRWLYRLINGEPRTAKKEPGSAKKWTRFDFRDLVSLRLAIDLAGGREALQPGRRLRFNELERACTTLRRVFGLTNPLIEARLERTERGLLAIIESARVEPETGQLWLPGVRATIEDAVRNEAGRLTRAVAHVSKTLDRQAGGLIGLRTVGFARGSEARPYVQRLDHALNTQGKATGGATNGENGIVRKGSDQSLRSSLLRA